MDEIKNIFNPFRLSQYDFEEEMVINQIKKLFDPDAYCHLPYPIGDVIGLENFYKKSVGSIFKSMPDLERRDYIVISGTTDNGDQWIGCSGFYCGTFLYPFLDIPPTGHLAHMRFHEFYRFKNNKIVEVQSIWDIPELMMQANAWPLAPSLGKEWCIPGPVTMDGIKLEPGNTKKSAASLKTVVKMLSAMKKHPAEGGPEIMEMTKYWHPKLNWYGPSGIGTGRGISGFRNWHQIPFLNAMPDRGKTTTYNDKHGWGDQISYHFFAEDDYVAVTGWPNMIQTLSHDGWLGIAPPNKKIQIRSLDFWRLENGKIRENWVLLDLLDIYRQIGIDVFARLKEFNKSRSFQGNKNYVGAMI
ncbi:MAG: polyketide cyclase [Rhodobacteraceae bacterium]|nr:MAG: polyketide cyclase [Paracoccaceae bacterium]